MAIELAKHKIRVNTIAPGWTDTGATIVMDNGATLVSDKRERDGF